MLHTVLLNLVGGYETTFACVSGKWDREVTQLVELYLLFMPKSHVALVILERSEVV